MIEVEAALEKIYQVLKKQKKIETISIANAVGRVCGEDVLAKIAVPNFNRAGVDGYAVFAEDTVSASDEHPVKLKVATSICAGEVTGECRGQKGMAVRIMTGAPIPTGFNGVIKQEWTDQGDEEVSIYKNIQKGDNYSQIGEDISLDKKIISKYQLLNSRSVGILATQGIENIKVLAPMKIGILTTGTELLSLEESLSEGKIYNSNLHMLASFIQASGSEIVFKEQCEDQLEKIAQLIDTKISDVDLLITTGGVSVGEKDYLPEVIQKINGRCLFHRVNMKPGTPIMASLYKERVILSLSGNPFAVMINLHMFYWPILSYFMSCPKLNLEKREVELAHDLKVSGIRRFIRAYEENGIVSVITTNHFSSVFQNTLETNCFIDQPVKKIVKKGDKVTIYYWKL